MRAYSSNRASANDELLTPERLELVRRRRRREGEEKAREEEKEEGMEGRR